MPWLLCCVVAMCDLYCPNCYASGLCEASDMESPRGASIRIQHVTAGAAAAAAAAAAASDQPPPADGRSRFPKLDECAHFHYDFVELGPLQVSLYEEELKPLAGEAEADGRWQHVQVLSGGRSWVLRRSLDNFRMLDCQLHRCIYDRKFSGLPELPADGSAAAPRTEEGLRRLLSEYLARFSQIAGSLINCGPVLNWLELDNRGRRLLVPDGDNCPINTPAVAAAYAVKRYTAQAGDEISFEVGDMISVIDMPPPEESVWWRGKRGFQVGFFPCECVAVIGDKVPRNLQLPASAPAPALVSAPALVPSPALGSSVGGGSASGSGSASPGASAAGDQPSKPVLRKHGKLIAFFRSFILSRPSRRRLKQSGILKERVFGCDLGEHLLNSGHEIPMVLKCCAEFIETNGIVDGIYRLSGVNSNIQKLRNAFDEDRVPALYEDEAILQDIHSVASLLKMYFRELPNPLCTYQLYHTFVSAVQSSQEEGYRLLRMRDAVQKLPPPHYRTLEYLMRHLARVARHGHATGMTPRNVAIVWAPNLLRCKELEVGGVAALQGVGVQAVVTEFLVCYTDLIFSDGLPPVSLPMHTEVTPKRCRPKSLAISTPTKLLSLEEARSRALSAGKADQEYIEVGGGPANLPAKYHTVLELPGTGGRKRAGSKRSPLGWKSFFSKSGRKTASAAPQRKASTPSELGLPQEKAVTEADLAGAGPGRRRLRPVKSAESLASGASSSRNSTALDAAGGGPGPGPADTAVGVGALASPEDGAGAVKPGGHSRSVSHDSYFDSLADTPLHARPATRPSRLTEEENEENFSSSLDLSEIHLNFDLEESEMRIFSEDETLISVSLGSNSCVSQGQGSPRMPGRERRTPQAQAASKRQPVRDGLLPALTPGAGPGGRVRPESALGAEAPCASADPSPKKQKTCGGVGGMVLLAGAGGGSPGSSRSKRSRLEEQLGPAADFRYIDSQSPEGQQMLVQADVHEQFSAAATPSSASTASCGPNPATSPSLAEATVSDNESFTVLSSELTTPDTPLLGYAPLHEEANSSPPTPDYENLLLLGRQPPQPLPRQTQPRYQRLASPSPSPPPPAPPYVNMASPLECRITIVYENVRAPTGEPAGADGAAPGYEPMTETDAGGAAVPGYEPMTVGSAAAPAGAAVYQNVPWRQPPLSALAGERREDDDHLYEDIQLALSAGQARPCSAPGHCGPSDRAASTAAAAEADAEPDPERALYQQVKEFRRSVHEVNQLLEPSPPSSPAHPQEAASQPVIPAGMEVESEAASAPPAVPTPPPTPVAAPGCDDALSSAGSSPERRACVGGGTGPEPSRRRLESEIGRDILRERKIQQELQLLRLASTGNNSAGPSTPASRPQSLGEEPHTHQQPERTATPDSSDRPRPEPDLPSPRPQPQPRARPPPSPTEQPDTDGVTLRLKLHTHDSPSTQAAAQTDTLPPARPELLRPARPGSAGSTGGHVRDLLCRFEPPSPPADSGHQHHPLTPQPARRSDPGPGPRPAHTASLPPCLRARAARAARSRLTALSPLSVSLDGQRFPAEPALVRVRTSPDIHAPPSQGSQAAQPPARGVEGRPDSAPAPGGLTASAAVCSSVLRSLQNTMDLDDPERRQRIERYKEERRMFLREKYRSESFRGERDEVLARLKQRTGRIPSDDAAPADESARARGRLTGPDVSPRPSLALREPRDRRKSPDTSPVDPEPPCERRSSVSGGGVELRLSPRTTAPVPAPRDSPRACHRTCESPSYCIKDMAALFEARDATDAGPGTARLSPT